MARIRLRGNSANLGGCLGCTEKAQRSERYCRSSAEESGSYCFCGMRPHPWGRPNIVVFSFVVALLPLCSSWLVKPPLQPIFNSLTAVWGMASNADGSQWIVLMEDMYWHSDNSGTTKSSPPSTFAAIRKQRVRRDWVSCFRSFPPTLLFVKQSHPRVFSD